MAEGALMGPDGKQPPCPACEAKKRAAQQAAQQAAQEQEQNARMSAHASHEALGFVFCPACVLSDGKTVCRITKAECHGRIEHSVHRDASGSLVEEIGFPCQEPSVHVIQFVQLMRRPATKLPPVADASPTGEPEDGHGA